MTLLKFTDVSLAFGTTPLLDKVSWQIEKGERVCIIGRNGTGKSSMLKLVKGEQMPDDGDIWRAPALKIGELPQELPVADERTVYDVVAEGLAEVGELLSRYHHLSQHIQGDDDLIVPADGRDTPEAGTLLAARDVLAARAQRNGCDPEPETTAPTDGVRELTWTSCDAPTALVELAAACPPELKLAHGGKGVLKEAARGVVPDVVMDRPKGYFPVPAIRHREGPFLERVRDAVTDPVAKARGLVRTDWLERMLAAPNTSRTNLGSNALWQAALLEMWLQERGV